MVRSRTVGNSARAAATSRGPAGLARPLYFAGNSQKKLPDSQHLHFGTVAWRVS